ncbi:MAG TPA: hypothetical protein VMT88_06610 [Actinomycetes bacterium]|nr:hypothetical protein [Actinomycetes bacterium]
MCGDEGHTHEHSPASQSETPSLSRRRLLSALGVVGAGAAAGTLFDATKWAIPAGAATIDGSSPFSMAMHIHSSFSEGAGSMSSHLDQATRNGVKVVWWTDHDFRMSAFHYRKVVHFTSLTQEQGDGSPWTWVHQTTGTLTAASGGGIVQSPASPIDPVVGGSLSLKAESATSGWASDGYYADSHPAGWNYHNSLYGQTLSLEVMPTSVGSGAYLELLVGTSFHPAGNGRPAGVYTLSYRIGGPGTPGTRVADGLAGIVYLDAVPNQWNSIVVNPCDDIAALWPDLDSRDFACNALTMNAVSGGPVASGNFDYLRFSRAYTSGDVPLTIQRSIQKGYASKYKSVKQRRAIEMGQFLPHINWFGGALHLPHYDGVTKATHLEFMRQQIENVHAAGGLASYNHPYGYTSIGPLPASQQDTLRSEVATAFLQNNVIGCDIIEVGYKLRAGVDLAHHVSLWDILSRNAKFLTANGVSDDHAGNNWAGLSNNWVTSAWATDRSEVELLAALKSGRAWTSSLTGFKGELDLLVDSAIPMGSASISSQSQRQLQVIATNLPTGGTVRVIRGTVDYAGTASPVPNTSVVATLSASDLSTGSASLSIDTTKSRFVRTEVRNGSGATVAVSNPVWLLRETPPNGIPAERQRTLA